MPRTKIICTLGPASSSTTIIRNMMIAGMDVARLNFSHGSHADHAGRIREIRTLNKRSRRHIRILQDLEGYRIRLGTFTGPREIPLKKKQFVKFIPQGTGSLEHGIPFDYHGDLRAIKPGSAMYIDDGAIVLSVVNSSGRCLDTQVVIGGVLKERKGINLPGVALKFHGLTEKDKRDLAFGVEQQVDYVAQSFVRDAADVTAVRLFLGDKLPGCKIIAKIENREGIANIDRILGVADGIMIARGDMGVSLPIYEVPIIQKHIIRACNRAGKFVITATQMMESMIENIRPTRAEVADVANAIIDGTDFVMLSAESAVGRYPVETVRMMNDIIVFTEKASLREKI